MLDFLKENFWSILIVLNYLVAISAAITILFKNINPTKTLSYIIVLVFFPFFGIFVYYFFGQEYRKNKIFNRKHILNKNIVQEINKELTLNQREIKKIDAVLDEKFKLVRLLHNSENELLTLHNEVSILKNGNEKFKHLFEDIKSANHHIHLEYYIIKDDIIGTKLIDLLCKKSKEGVSVRMSYDDVGSEITSKSLKKMKANGIECYPFMPVFFSRFTGKMNYRNHRKIVIIDGTIGYVGGINVSDKYVNSKSNDIYWRDTHLRITGEAVKSLQIHFFTTWDFVSNASIKVTKTFFPETNTKRQTAVQIAASGPDTDRANIMEALFVAINTAEDYIYLTTPYFIPNDQIITSIQVAAKSGLDVKILIPKASDSWTAKYATNSYLEKLIESGVKVHRYTKGFVHAKTLVVDDIFSTVGTANLDYRSFNINFEINALIYDKKISQELKKQFLEDIKDSEEIDLESWKNRSRFNKLKESFCRLWAPLL